MYRQRYLPRLRRKAGARERALRRRFHQLLDPLWRRKKRWRMARRRLYRRLAEALGIAREACHASFMTADELEKAIRLLEEWNEGG